jgi:hypothetical protein
VTSEKSMIAEGFPHRMWLAFLLLLGKGGHDLLLVSVEPPPGLKAMPPRGSGGGWLFCTPP